MGLLQVVSHDLRLSSTHSTCLCTGLVPISFVYCLFIYYAVLGRTYCLMCKLSVPHLSPRLDPLRFVSLYIPSFPARILRIGPQNLPALLDLGLITP